MTDGIRTPGVERLQAAAPAGPEEELDRTLRPRVLDDFVGQRAVKDQLAVFIEAARGRGEALDHVLLAGPPGLGKTSLAQIVANELDVPFVQTAGPALERKGDVAAFLTALEPRAVFFVDEIHQLPRAVEETFYPAMEDRKLPITVGQGAGARVVTLDLPQFTLIGATTRTGLLTTPLRDRFGVTHRLDLYGSDDLADIVVGQGPAARPLTLDLPPFTLIGATTRTGLLTTPLRDRFGMTFRLGYYEQEELATIVRRSAEILGVRIEQEAAAEIARRARGTPRVANRILRRVRDVAEVRHEGAITLAIAREALELHEVDELGLERTDRELLRAVVDRFGGGPVGLSTLAVALGEEPDTIEDVYEPYLLQLGFLQRTPRGRVVTDLGRAHVGTAPADDSLF